ncbi:hypothetical protein [Cellulomonas sp. HZM]|uniref:hypothetical protein n=1 Tax=Cellulomonas sp. HZM TaxID=1454010 RepID=UPI0012DED938|nr:hypothetical protein [Cellulomonas sp. HZM]
MSEGLPVRGVVFWPVGTGDSSTIVVDESLVVQVDLHDMRKAQAEANPEAAVVDELVAALPTVGEEPYLAVFALTHIDKDHCLGFADLLARVRIGEIWATPRMWREYLDEEIEEPCADAVAFREECERRIAAVTRDLGLGITPSSGDRIRVIGYDTDHDKHAYNELPDEYLAWPGQTLTVLDGEDCSGRFEAFIHAPFKNDEAEPRNDTSLAMQVTLIDGSGVDGKVLLFGDLAHDTIMKIFDYSEAHDRPERLEWDLLLAPHHCSKYVMHTRVDGELILQQDVLDALEKHARVGAKIVASSSEFPDVDVDGNNPPHRAAADRYAEICDELICTMSWFGDGEPEPVVFGVDASGARIISGELVELSAQEAGRELRASAAGGRFAAITAAAKKVASTLPAASSLRTTGPERVAAAVAADRGGARAPENPVGFGC